MGSSEPEERPQMEQLPPTDVEGLLGLLNRHRAEIDKNFETVAQMITAQNSRHLRALEIQKRWNYGLTAALVIVTTLAAILYFRGA